MAILGLPQELLSEVLSCLGPSDVVNFGQTCHYAYSFIDAKNALLWQACFQHVFDDPERACALLTDTAKAKSKLSRRDWDWHHQLKRRLLALKAIGSEWTDKFLADEAPSQEDTINTILDIIDSARPHAAEEEPSLNLSQLPAFSDISVKFDRLIRGSYSSDTTWYAASEKPVTRSSVSSAHGNRSENAARLHIFLGVGKSEKEDMRALGAARRLVYDQDSTNASNDYGCFKQDGSGEVDWPRLEAAFSVGSIHLSRAMQNKVKLPQGFNYAVPYEIPRDPKTPDDWAGVTGSWFGTYVFLNWEDFVTFNISLPETRPSLEDGPESCGGLSKLILALDKTLEDDPVLQPKLPYCKDLSPLYFSGVSQNHQFRRNIGVRGMACLCPSAREVRWKFIIRYSGSDQWQLEGVQPGGIRSGCIYGLWTSTTHEEDSPVGPFLYAPVDLCDLDLL